MRRAATLALAAAVTAIALWLGEDLGRAIPLGVFFVLPAGALLGFWLSPYRALAGALGVASAIVLLGAGGWYAGRVNATAAFNDCLERGEAVRVSLARFEARNGRFPQGLDRLAHRDLPGRRWLRGTVLAYRSTAQGYELSCSDWLVTHQATESTAFAAQK